jgi:peroxiredoxin
MRRARLLALLLLATCGLSLAAVVGKKVADFTLMDQDGLSHELYRLKDKKAVVLMTQFNGCPIVRLAVPALRELKSNAAYGDIEFLLLNSAVQDTPASVAKEAQDFGFKLPVLLDSGQHVAEALGVDRTGEVYVIDPKDWTVRFHGPIDDRLNYETQRPVHQRYLADALDAVLSDRPVAKSEVVSPGCLITFPNRKRG